MSISHYNTLVTNVLNLVRVHKEIPQRSRPPLFFSMVRHTRNGTEPSPNTSSASQSLTRTSRRAGVSISDGQGLYGTLRASQALARI
ncbi:hypothetical protein PROFUN_02474 [Planoprotostelium fungivorum]|uniref:Uncharacterized protein n=1 Tax=Planoprotostelium fungivorum TaxID=1890364 RepID=A0A2P6MP64_9EUKA|nr:hypothetical protein PROFUN_02474 [Planoprotostelium fungivorum]